MLVGRQESVPAATSENAHGFVLHHNPTGFTYFVLVSNLGYVPMVSVPVALLQKWGHAGGARRTSTFPQVPCTALEEPVWTISLRSDVRRENKNIEKGASAEAAYRCPLAQTRLFSVWRMKYWLSIAELNRLGSRAVLDDCRETVSVP